MTATELVALGASKIRKNEELMRLYIGYYEDAFSLTPNCAPCTFESDFNKLKKYLSTGFQKAEKPKTMEKRTHVLKRNFRNQILTYKKDGRPFRSYGYLMTDDFAEAFIAAASDKKEKENRKEMFDVLPSKEVEAKNNNSVSYTESDLSKLKRSEIDELLISKGLNPEDYSNSKVAKEALLKN